MEMLENSYCAKPNNPKVGIHWLNREYLRTILKPRCEMNVSWVFVEQIRALGIRKPCLARNFWGQTATACLRKFCSVAFSPRGRQKYRIIQNFERNWVYSIYSCDLRYVSRLLLSDIRFYGSYSELPWITWYVSLATENIISSSMVKNFRRSIFMQNSGTVAFFPVSRRWTWLKSAKITHHKFSNILVYHTFRINIFCAFRYITTNWGHAGPQQHSQLFKRSLWGSSTAHCASQKRPPTHRQILNP